MFTGLIEEIGSVIAVDRDGQLKLMIKAKDTLEGIQLGHSIAVEGVCLTVTDFNDSSFCVGLAPETCARTHLKNAKAGTLVNLERAVLPATRLGGHYVQGHVDAIGTILSITQDESSLRMRIQPAAGLMRYVVPKGYITIDGASLTIVDTGSNWFSIMLIDYSSNKLTLGAKQVGDPVNLEVDILAKYVERLLDFQKNYQREGEPCPLPV